MSLAKTIRAWHLPLQPFLTHFLLFASTLDVAPLRWQSSSVLTSPRRTIHDANLARLSLSPRMYLRRCRRVCWCCRAAVRIFRPVSGQQQIKLRA